MQGPSRNLCSVYENYNSDEESISAPLYSPLSQSSSEELPLFSQQTEERSVFVDDPGLSEESFSDMSFEV